MVDYKISSDYTTHYDPPLYVFTSDKYLGCLPIWCHLFNKYWHSRREKNVTVLGYSTPIYEGWDFPNNIKFVSLGEQQPVEKWSNKILEYLKTQDFDYIQWCTEDSFLSYNVNFTIYDHILELLQKESIGRFALTNDFQYVTKPNKFLEGKSEYNICEADKNAVGRISGTWSIFSRECFFKVIKPNMSPWEFEQYGERDSEGSDSFEFRILGAEHDWPLRTTCAIRTTGRNSKNKNKVWELPLRLNPINEEPAPGLKYRPFPSDALQELKDLNFLDEECKLIVKFGIAVS